MAEYTDWQQRVLQEYDELKEKTKRLEVFLAYSKDPDLEHEDRRLLQKQAMAMHKYLQVLEERIMRFKVMS